MQTETLDHRTITEADAREIAELLIAIWPKPGRTVDSRTAEILTQWRNYHGPEAQHTRSFVVREGGRIVAHAQAEPRTVKTPAGDITVLALCRVCTDPTIRGKKLGQAVVQEAFKLVDNGAFRFALFQTRDVVRPFYEKLRRHIGQAIASSIRSPTTQPPTHSGTPPSCATPTLCLANRRHRYERPWVVTHRSEDRGVRNELLADFLAPNSSLLATQLCIRGSASPRVMIAASRAASSSSRAITTSSCAKSFASRV